jgi:DNA-binding MarR family transcriptional regulator
MSVKGLSPEGSPEERDPSAVAEELQFIAERLIRISRDDLGQEGSVQGDFDPSKIGDDAILAAAQSLVQARRRREKHFSSALLGEPAWDMLLELAISAVTGARLNTTSLCAASGAPFSTALRTMRLLESEGFLRRSRAKDDRRVTLVEITAEGLRKVRAYITELLRREDTRGLITRPARIH